MSSHIIESDNYFTIKHNLEILGKQNFELAYSQLVDMVLYRGKAEYKIGICDFSSIKTLAVSEGDIQMITNALIYIFQSKPNFHFIVVALDAKVKEIVNSMHEQLRDICGVENLYLVPDTESAQQLIHQLDLS